STLSFESYDASNGVGAKSECFRHSACATAGAWARLCGARRSDSRSKSCSCIGSIDDATAARGAASPVDVYLRLLFPERLRGCVAIKLSDSQQRNSWR